VCKIGEDLLPLGATPRPCTIFPTASGAIDPRRLQPDVCSVRSRGVVHFNAAVAQQNQSAKLLTSAMRVQFLPAAKIWGACAVEASLSCKQAGVSATLTVSIFSP